MIDHNKIMIIEDNEDDFEAISRALNTPHHNIELDWHQNSEKAVGFLTSMRENNISAPKLIILDLNLPGLDGRKVLNILKSNKFTQVIPIVVFSTSENKKDIDYCYQKGANSYVKKPIKYGKLKEVCISIRDYWLNTSSVASNDVIA